MMIFFSYCSIIFFVFFQWGRMRNPEGWWRIGDTELFSSYIYGQTVRPSALVTGFVTIISPNYLLLIFILSTKVNPYFFFRPQRRRKTKDDCS